MAMDTVGCDYDLPHDYGYGRGPAPPYEHGPGHRYDYGYGAGPRDYGHGPPPRYRRPARTSAHTPKADAANPQPLPHISLKPAEYRLSSPEADVENQDQGAKPPVRGAGAGLKRQIRQRIGNSLSAEQSVNRHYPRT
jgi:hypothetical protein